MSAMAIVKCLFLLAIGIGSLVYIAGGFDALETAALGALAWEGFLGVAVFRALFGGLIMLYLLSLGALMLLAVRND